MKKQSMYWTLITVFWMAAINGASADEINKTAVPTMDQVVVSVTQTETTTSDIGGNSVTVITTEEIEQRNPHTVLDLLKTVPGVFVTSSGGMGTTSSVFIRGADSKNTLVMLDGIILNDPSNANRSADLSDINLDQVERIEVVRGAMSVMYGSNATSGVINIITKKAPGIPRSMPQSRADLSAPGKPGAMPPGPWTG